MKEKERERINEFLIPWVRCYVFCFSNESTDKWKKIFCEKRLNTFLETSKDMIEEVLGIDLDNQKTLKEFKKIYEELFLKEVEEYLTVLKKTKDEEEREKIKMNGVKRKTTNEKPNNKKRK